MYEQILSVAPEAMGHVAGYVIFALLCVGVWKSVKYCVKKAKQKGGDNV